MSWRGLGRLGIWWLVAVMAALGVAAMALSWLRQGGYLLGASLLLAALLRAVLPAPRGGGLEVRSRTLDLLTLVALAALVLTAFALVKLTQG